MPQADSTDSVKLPNHRCSVCGEEWPTTGSHLCKPQSTDSVKPEPELRCFGSGCQERGPFASEATAGMHENAYHDGAQTVFLVEPNATGLGWQMAGTWRS